MAALDSLLRAVVKNQMEAAILAPGRLPRLAAGGVEREVTQVPVDAARIVELVAEISPPGWSPPGDLSRSIAEPFSYALDGVVFSFQVSAGPEGWDVRATPLAGTEIGAIVPLLETLLERRGSDLHVSSGHPPRLRIDGEMAELTGYAPPASDDLQRLLFEITPERNRRQYAESNDTDFAYEIPGKARFRVNLFRDHAGFGAVLRLIPNRIPTAEQLGLPESIRKLTELAKGLVLVTGPTGSGKSTTLAALIDLINRTRRDHIITIEDPIEFVHVSRRCLVNQREVGVHTGSFKQALRAALREDPDIVLVGEMRDLETVSIAIETAETGHLVFGTLHTSTAPSTVERVIDQFPGDRQGQIRLMLADSLRAVIAQTLLKRVGGGRVAAYEILLSTPAVANLIREGKTFQIASAMQTGRAHGLTLLNDALLALIDKRLVEPREAYLKSIDKDGLLTRLKAAGRDVTFVQEMRAPS